MYTNIEKIDACNVVPARKDGDGVVLIIVKFNTSSIRCINCYANLERNLRNGINQKLLAVVAMVGRCSPNHTIFLKVSGRRFYVIIVLFLQLNGLSLNAKKNVSVRIRWH